MILVIIWNVPQDGTFKFGAFAAITESASGSGQESTYNPW